MVAPVHQPESETLPLKRQEGTKGKQAVLNAEAGEAVDDGHPGAGHTGYVQAIIGVLIVVVEIKARRTQVQLIRLLLVAELGSKDGVHTGGQGRLVNRHRFIEIEVALLRFPVVKMSQEEEPLKNIGLLDEA
jgi:hypothetical protein